MELNLKERSEEFQFFYEAFSPETYGRSMGRAADVASVEFVKLSAEEKQVATEWFLQLFQECRDYYGLNYFRVVEQMGDKRFIPLLKAYYKRLKKRHRKTVFDYLNGHKICVRTNFCTELQTCKRVIRGLKRQK